jgi:hypothetical protein
MAGEGIDFRTPMTGEGGELPSTSANELDRALNFGAVGLLAVALFVFLVGGAPRNLSPVRTAPLPTEVALPEALEPQGTLEVPPAVFRWKPSGARASLSQVIVTGSDLTRIWTSRPLAMGTTECDVLDPSVFGRAVPGQALFWRVREVSGGKPRGASPFVKFTLSGSPGSEAPAAEDVLRQ